jgi:hypothetical protein
VRQFVIFTEFSGDSKEYGTIRYTPRALELMRIARGTTKVGFVNSNGQVVIRNTGKAGTDRGQKIYQLGCSDCGDVYGANGADIWDRKCPKCQTGKPGFQVI